MRDSLIGGLVADRYEVLGLLGSGGMGSVYTVRHRRLRRTFAMKRLSKALADNADALARFHREADVIANLRHPNIVEIVDWETLDDGTPCMIMEYLKGEDLSRRLAGKGVLSWAFLGRIADQVLSALSVAHRAGIVHRDLKPENIFIEHDDAGEERAKLLDFGVSKIPASRSVVTEEHRLLGTPAYMSPEQAAGRSEKVDFATDVWAMGAILYEMATGRLAFFAENVPSVLFRICHDTPQPLDRFRPDAPPAFVELVGRALSRDPAVRITRIDRLREELRSALAAIAPEAFPEPLFADPRLLANPELSTARYSPAEVCAAAPDGTKIYCGLPSLEDAPTRKPTTLSLANGQKSRWSGSVTRSRRRTVWLCAATVCVVGVVGIGRAISHSPRALAAEHAIIATPEHASVATPEQPIVAKPEIPPAAASAPAPAPRSSVVMVRRWPRSAQMTLDGHAVSGDGVLVAHDGRAHLLRISAPGFLAQSRPLDAKHCPSVVAIKLHRPAHASKRKHPLAARAPEPARPPERRSWVDPFASN
jgi:serine/threonine-protein kinase